MKLRYCLLIILLITILTDENILSAPFDTGMTTFEQPNGIEFTGRIWGDEFFWYAETEAGYRFIQSGDGWYYYAQLSENGEFTKTEYKVGIDEPSSESYHLERTQARIDEINQMIDEFIEQTELNKQWFAQKQAEAQGQPVTLKIGLILIEFQDVKHFEDENYRPNGYLTADFDSMMFSNNYWIGEGINSPHPEGEEVFGSFTDYWDQISCGKLKIEGRVANPTDGNGIPRWLTANYDRQYYTELYAGFTILANEAVQKAVDHHYISLTPGDPNYYDVLAIVYAQYPIRGVTSSVGVIPNTTRYILGEQIGPVVYNPGKTFTHIGLHLNSFGAIIGCYDGSDGVLGNPTPTQNFDLMNSGWANGPNRKGECSATLAPYFRIENGWVEPITITQDSTNFLVEYDYQNPKLYKLDPIGGPKDMHYLFEVRKRVGFDSYIPEPPETYQNQSGTLLIWQHNADFWFAGFHTVDKIRLKQADYIISGPTQLDDFFPCTGYNNNQSINDTTLPAASLGDFFDEYYENYINPAHFALNGIQKLENGNTLINEIRLNHAIIKKHISGGWQTVSVGAILSDYNATSVYPTLIDTLIYAYIPGQGYVRKYILNNGTGYWGKFGLTQNIVYAGLILDSLDIAVSKGWNLIGTISNSVIVSNICTEPPGIIGTIYSYDGGYHYLDADDSIKAGTSYWVNSNNNGNIILSRNFNCSEQEEINLSTMDKFIVMDSEGKRQDLYVANVDLDTSLIALDRSLPPPMPFIEFDARFNYGEFIKAISGDSGLVDLWIDVESNAYPITLSWEINPENGIEYSFINDSTLGKVSQIKDKNGQARFSKDSEGKIKLFGKVNYSGSTNLLPEKFELLQNYPNPFNPITTIKYAIPKTVNVELKVFDILGREIKTLINETRNAGYYGVQFNANDFASGVYFYRLKATPIGGQAGEYIKTGKMLLIK